MSDEKMTFGFLHWKELDEKKTIRGGCLVTDLKTYPLEFRCTSPIQFTDIQRVLYGKNLQEYIGQELVASPLLRDLIHQPKVFFVSEPQFLPSLRKILKVPTFLVDATQNPPLIRNNAGYASDVEIFKTLKEELRSIQDLTEPFARLEQALIAVHRLGVLDNQK